MLPFTFFALTMLTDIFARRYEKVLIWKVFDEPSKRLLVQGTQLLEQIFPYYLGGSESQQGKLHWNNLHDLMSRELGLPELSPKAWGFYDANKHWFSGINKIHDVCKTWMLQSFDENVSADRFIKERLSLVELGFRTREKEVRLENSRLPQKILEAKQFDQTRHLRKGIFLPGDRSDGIKAQNESTNREFQSAVDELNARLFQAGCNLTYHNGFIQIDRDEMLTETIANPFWRLCSDPKWKNVDHDMKEAIDLRDTGGRDPALYAAKALESAIKIISDEKNFSTGNEKGAGGYIDNLAKNKFIEDWEKTTLKTFFSNVRNPLGHGPGSDEMPSLTKEQTDWAIMNCMAWTKSLIERFS